MQDKRLREEYDAMGSMVSLFSERKKEKKGKNSLKVRQSTIALTKKEKEKRDQPSFPATSFIKQKNRL